jgi:hypothetical protein
VGSDEDHGRRRRPSAEDQGWSQRLDTRWPDDREVGDTVCGLYRAHKDEKRVFLG